MKMESKNNTHQKYVKINGKTIEIHTQDQADYKVLFATKKTEELINKLIRDKTTKRINQYEYSCLNENITKALMQTSAR